MAGWNDPEKAPEGPVSVQYLRPSLDEGIRQRCSPIIKSSELELEYPNENGVAPGELHEKISEILRNVREL